MSENKVGLLNSPYGEVNYESFRKLKRAFADKSGMIRYLDDIGMTRFPVLLRPRRFGKSTFVQMLKCFYDISYADRYEELFSGTDIYNEHLESHNTFHVLNFDFSGVSGFKADNLIRSFIIAVGTDGSLVPQAGSQNLCGPGLRVGTDLQHTLQRDYLSCRVRFSLVL